ncbi:MAG: PAS domain-containing protein [Desulfobacteraceae bacterium]
MQKEAFWNNINFLSEILDTAHNGAVIVDKDGKIRLFNEIARKILTVQEPEIIGKHIASVSSKEARRDMCRILKTGHPRVNKTGSSGNAEKSDSGRAKKEGTVLMAFKD